MSHALSLVFWSLALFQTKHLICDYMLQTPFQYLNKGKYGHPGGIIHAGIHMLGSIPAIVLFGPTLGLVAALLAMEFAVHYHVDWLKEQITKRRGLSHSGALFWAVFGADQFLHQMTYLAMLAVLARAANL